MNVGIIGFGTVGQSTCALLDHNEVDLRVVDPTLTRSHTTKDLINTSLIYVSVPTEEVENLLIELSNVPYKGIVVVRSTCTYSMLKGWNLNLVYHPSFIQEHGSFDDHVLQESQGIVGGDVDICTQYVTMFSEIGICDIEFTRCTLQDACSVKLLRNLFGAYKVLFWNFVQRNFGCANNIADLIENCTPPQGMMSNVGQDGELGYGGKCFPSNVALVASEIDDTLLKFLKEYNDELQGKRS